MTIPMNFSERNDLPASGCVLQRQRLCVGPRFLLVLTATFGCLLLVGCNQNSSESAAVDDNDAMLNELLGSLDTTPEADEELDSSSASDASNRNSPTQTAAASRGAASGAGANRPAVQDPFAGSGFQNERGALAPGQNGGVVQAAATGNARTAHNQRSADLQQVGGTQQNSSGGQTGHRLELRLSPGDQFPLVKTVTQNLVQKSAQWPASAETHLELHMHMRVEDARADGILMSVQYTRIVYRHDINGQQLAFDSASGRLPEAAELLPYAGMVNNGFAFWLGRNNKIRELVGYQEFLQRCVQQVPAANQQQLLQQLAARFGDNGVASFVDEAIGLLPYSETAQGNQATLVSAGDVWMHERRMTHPVPLMLKSTCRLLAIDNQTAEIDMTGRITQTAEAVGSGVQVRDGRSMGSCVIDQATGLPLRLNRSTYLDMLVAVDNGQTVEQEKRVETTIQTQPATGRNDSQAAAAIPQHAIPQHSGMQQQSMSHAASAPQPVPAYAQPPANSNGSFAGQQNAGQQYAGQQQGVQQAGGQYHGSGYVQPASATTTQTPVPVPAGLGLPFGQKREDVQSNGFRGPTPIPGGPTAAQLPSTVQAVYPD